MNNVFFKKKFNKLEQRSIDCKSRETAYIIIEDVNILIEQLFKYHKIVAADLSLLIDKSNKNPLHRAIGFLDKALI